METRRNRARIVRNRCVPVSGHRAGYLGLAWLRFRPNSGSKSKISCRILKVFGALFSSAETSAFHVYPKLLSTITFQISFINLLLKSAPLQSHGFLGLFGGGGEGVGPEIADFWRLRSQPGPGGGPGRGPARFAPIFSP